MNERTESTQLAFRFSMKLEGKMSPSKYIVIDIIMEVLQNLPEKYDKEEEKL